MNRRAFLGLLTGATAGLAGCTEGNIHPPIAGFPAPENPDPTVIHGFPGTVCGDPPNPFIGIEAVLEPAVGPDWGGLAVAEKYRFGYEVGPGLSEDAYVVGIERNGVARAYPLSILWWHEVVNDTLGGDPVLVTYCPICQSGMVAERRVGGVEALFQVSGHLWQPPAIYGFASVEAGRTFGASASSGDADVRNSGNLVLYDEATGSYWSQLLAKAICGTQSGEKLRILPSTVATWGEWRAAYPETDALLPPPWSKTA
ncbi:MULTISPECIES: DUF3179 domain-containing (seleno)protein [Haloferax]|uniref:DUF3179 domain-containing protein n=2 Tax=Haloferax TaxID=2251 RepID=A0A6G1Z0I5_9EURY|nr:MULTISPECIES: DUF3179 domain-containing (seleno)protein [Haloferax]KAB1187385.1 DUF3179 domain-containing protein [Haloferax sp. CBA1149]MRW80032.1 DUF3179 domain-containing protein [Haloferax marinisediminis]